MFGTRIDTTERGEAVQRLVHAAQGGDRQAFGGLIERYQRAVYAMAYRHLGNDAETQEVCQEMFLRALRKIGQLREPRVLRGLAARRWLRACRSIGPCVAGRGFGVTSRSTSFVPGSRLRWADMLAGECRAQVQSRPGAARALDRQTLVAFYFDGRTLLEMSDQFHSPVGTIKRRLHVARRRLAEELASLAPV